MDQNSLGAGHHLMYEIAWQNNCNPLQYKILLYKLSFALSNQWIVSFILISSHLLVIKLEICFKIMIFVYNIYNIPDINNKQRKS